ncbi:MAG TPA: DNA polymerase III subunit alpha [Saprospirales bacterium]|nr:DNA polymerase III subunit alpha [Saprospirales bacterium]
MYLNTHSYFSLRYGTCSPEKLAERAAALGIRKMVLTDINNTSASYEFIQACRKFDITAALGIEFRRDHRFLYIGIARNREGFRELNEFLTRHSLEDTLLPDVAPRFEHAYIIYRALIKPLEDFADNEFLGVRPEEVNKLFMSPVKDRQDKMVVLAPVTFQDDEGFKIHRLLRCIDLNIILGKLEPGDHARPTEYFLPEEELRQRFASYPAIIKNTERLIGSCTIEMPDTLSNNRLNFTGSEAGDFKLLSKLAIDGCKRRYGTDNEEAKRRTEKELKVIRQLHFNSYFLITWDIIRYAETSGFHHVGRGSGANSIVAYNLGITDVDPIELDLYFERFINPHRSSPPDFDLDFSWDQRDDVIDYMFKRYGSEFTAQLATYNTFKGKSIIRELGKVFGLPKEDIDTIVDHPMDASRHHHFAKYIFKYGKMIENFPNYLSIHAGGIIISEEPLNYFTALKMMPKGFPVTHFDMYAAEDLGFQKFDILSQRGLGHIKDAVKLIAQNQGKMVDIHQVAGIKQDPLVKKQLQSGQCTGCFYIESPAMRGLIKKLRCDNYIQLVAASSIIRPGVAKSGMMKEYIQRFHKPASFSYLHPIFEKHLSETFGVMVYQEDVLKIVHHFAGLDLNESDMLRRIMTGKRKDSDIFYSLQNKFLTNCRERGYSEELTREVWRQIESFSGYSFSKAHSASFAVESFQSLYLKTYFPVEFMVAVINNFGGFYSTEVYVHEARMAGASINAPCVNKSLYLTHVYGKEVYLGFIHMQSFETKAAHRIIREREHGGEFTSLEDFIKRVDIGREQLDLLIRIGAFRFTGMNKYELMWAKNAIFNPAVKHHNTAYLFDTVHQAFSLPVLEEGPYDQAFDEIELLGFPLSSPFELVESSFNGKICSAEFKKYTGQTVTILGYYITRKYVRTVQGKLMNFGTFIDKNGIFFDTVHFPKSLEQYTFKGPGCYAIEGKVVEEFGFPSIEVSRMAKLPYVKDNRY